MTAQNDERPGFEVDCEELHAVAAAALDQHRLAAHEAAIMPALGMPVTCLCGQRGSLHHIQQHALHEMIHAIMRLLAIKTDLSHHDSLAGTPVKEGWVDEHRD